MLLELKANINAEREGEIHGSVYEFGGKRISLALFPAPVRAGAFYLACKANRIRISKEVVGKAFHVSDRTVDTNERKI